MRYSEQQNAELVGEARRRVGGRDPAELGILFTYHKINKVMKRNLASLMAHNLWATTIPIATMQPSLPSGVRMEKNPFWSQLTGDAGDRCWANVDAVYYEFYRRREVNCRRWLLAEWDVFCNGDIRDFFGSLWGEDFVVIDIPKPGWHWFKDVKLLPENLRQKAFGMSPLACSLLSDEAMEKIVLGSWWIDRTVFCELRIATIANAAGVKITPNPSAKPNIKSSGRPAVTGEGLWHPMKE